LGGITKHLKVVSLASAENKKTYLEKSGGTKVKIMQEVMSYNKGYQDGFQHGFLTAIAMNTKREKDKTWEQDFLLQKKKARDWAISMGYLKNKK
jgi:hypothetical protein